MSSKLTSNREHLQPTPLLEHSDENDDSDDSERDDGKLLGEFVHRDLERSSFLFNLRRTKGRRSVSRSFDEVE